MLENLLSQQDISTIASVVQSGSAASIATYLGLSGKGALKDWFETFVIKRKSRLLAEAKAEEMKILGDQAIEMEQKGLEIIDPQFPLKLKPKSEEAFEAQGLVARMEARVVALEIRAQQNIEEVIAKAIEYLDGREIPQDKSPDPDKLADIFDNVRNVSNEEMQKIWAMLLAGEISEPDSFSTRTINFIKNLSTEEAQLLSRLNAYTVLNNGNGLSYVIKINENDSALSNYINFADILTLRDLGVLNSAENSVYNLNPAQYIHRYNQYRIIQFHTPDKGIYAMPAFILTKVGSQAMKLISTPNDLNYLNEVVLSFTNNGLHAFLVPN